MKQFIVYTVALLFSIGAFASDPHYATKQTQKVIEKMIEAHGGMTAWNKTKTFSFDNIMFSESLPEQPFWASKIYVDHKTRRVYQDWPLHESSMAYNGTDTWSVNWKIGNPPKFEALFFYYFLNLPWLTQDENVKLGKSTKTKHKAFEKEVYVIEMGFTEKPSIGKTVIDKYKLYIDTDSYLLLGYEYMIGYGHMLDLFQFPADKELFGPMFRINDSYTEVSGLKYPNMMHTSNIEQTEVYGYHTILNYSITGDFDEQRMTKPVSAVIDYSSHIRSLKN